MDGTPFPSAAGHTKLAVQRHGGPWEAAVHPCRSRQRQPEGGEGGRDLSGAQWGLSSAQ